MPETQLVTRAGVFGRLRLQFERWVRQAFSPVTIPYSMAGTGQVRQAFNARTAMSSLAVHPWVRACTRARCDDIGGLPLVVTDNGKLVPDHPFSRLIRNPSPGVTRTVFTRQLEADLLLAGNCYMWLVPVGDWWELHRLHPNHVTARVDRGRQIGWDYCERKLSMLEVFHVHDVSWQDDPSGMFGESAIRTLKDGLRAVQAARQHATAQADRGRPDVIMSFPENAGVGDQAATVVKDAYMESVEKEEPVFAVGGGVTVTPVTWNPKDVEFPGLAVSVRDETLAVLRVPPTRAGIPQANFAVAKAELRDYWSGLLSSDLQMFAEVFTEIAHVVGGSMSATVHHDTSAVEALQTSYDQRQARSGFWVTVMGADPAEAAAYEGFRGAPVGDVPGGQASSRPAQEVDDQPNRQAAMMERAIAAYLTQAAERLQGAGAGGADRDAETWRLAGLLELARVDDARELAAEIAAIVCEVAETATGDLAEMYAFSGSYARAVARRPRLVVAAAK